jgi:hypothetical protein
MFKVCNDWNVCNGTSRVGEMQVVYKDLILAFGEPMESDEHKVSGEWLFYNSETDEVFTLYDWKMTNLYDSYLPSVESLRTQDKVITVNIGGNHKGDINNFKTFVKAQINFAKTGKPFEQIILEVK